MMFLYDRINPLACAKRRARNAAQKAARLEDGLRRSLTVLRSNDWPTTNERIAIRTLEAALNEAEKELKL